MTMKNLLKNNLIDINKLLLEYYPKLLISADDFLVLLCIFNSKETNITMKYICEKTNKDEMEISSNLSSLMEKGFLALEFEQDDKGRTYERFNFDGTLNKIDHLIGVKTSSEDTQTKVIKELQNQFNKTISYFDIQRINTWLVTDGFSFDDIRKAITKAIAKGLSTLDDVDNILHNNDVVEQINFNDKNDNLIKDFFASWRK